MTDRYLSVARMSVHEIEIKRSRFLCALAPVTSEEAAREFIAARRRADPQARHHCHAFVLGPDGRTRRSSDDGEPAGTAGTPMLEVLRRRELTDAVGVGSRTGSVGWRADPPRTQTDCRGTRTDLSGAVAGQPLFASYRVRDVAVFAARGLLVFG